MIVGRVSGDFGNEYATLIKRGEGFSANAYFHPGDVPSIGYGFAFITRNMNGVHAARGLTNESLHTYLYG